MLDQVPGAAEQNRRNWITAVASVMKITAANEIMVQIWLCGDRACVWGDWIKHNLNRYIWILLWITSCEQTWEGCAISKRVNPVSTMQQSMPNDSFRSEHTLAKTDLPQTKKQCIPSIQKKAWLTFPSTPQSLVKVWRLFYRLRSFQSWFVEYPNRNLIAKHKTYIK